MLFARQRVILALLKCISKPVAHTDFQKLLLLYTKEREEQPSYDFVPYQFGGFSFTSYADKRRLIERGLLERDEHRWALSESGNRLASEDSDLLGDVSSFIKDYRDLRGDTLISEVYRRFPYYAVHSRIVERVLPSKRDREAIRAAQPKAHVAGLVTIGYEGKSLESYLNQLIQDSVTLLCDVRRNPLSRKYGFSKKTLGYACENVGIRYEHLPKLGIASEKRRGLKTPADYKALFAEYERDSLPHQAGDLEKISNWIGDGQRVSLTCYEKRPCDCHRHCVARALEKQFGTNLATTHL